jgi:hypothetical protein
MRGAILYLRKVIEGKLLAQLLQTLEVLNFSIIIFLRLISQPFHIRGSIINSLAFILPLLL